MNIHAPSSTRFRIVHGVTARMHPSAANATVDNDLPRRVAKRKTPLSAPKTAKNDVWTKEAAPQDKPQKNAFRDPNCRVRHRSSVHASSTASTIAAYGVSHAPIISADRLVGRSAPARPAITPAPRCNPNREAIQGSMLYSAEKARMLATHRAISPVNPIPKMK